VAELFKAAEIKANVNLNFVYTFSPYRAVNTLRLGYKNQPVKAA
jgi:hypothetical protein